MILILTTDVGEKVKIKIDGILCRKDAEKINYYSETQIEIPDQEIMHIRDVL